MDTKNRLESESLAEFFIVLGCQFFSKKSADFADEKRTKLSGHC